MIYISEELPKCNPDEQRYVKTFQAVDLSTNFYFSYTYDLTRTLADNILEYFKTGDELKSGLKMKYLWNAYLGELCYNKRRIARKWILPIIHGFLSSCQLNTNNGSLTLVLIARRSSKFAGTRFLKRGASFQGHVANEVETEQIVYDPSLLSFDHGRFTSFVQCRGSVPLIWWQDLTKVVGKPPIKIDLSDAFATVPALHFRDLFDSYGHPVVVVNLMKQRDKRSKEAALSKEYLRAISYLNQFLDPEQTILYCNFDMARCLKCDGNVLSNLEELGYNVLKSTGFFRTFAPFYCHKIRPPCQYNVSQEEPFNELIVQDRNKNQKSLGRQMGVARVNCVDCLDRTNVAQLVMGKVALAYQLHALAVVDEPYLSWDSEIFRSFETLFEVQGDTLALQYAGSQLVHSVRTYKKISVLQERSRDVIQTLSRYYSNTFADYDKQNALNLFLGVYVPGGNCKMPLWELQNNFWLQNSQKFRSGQEPNRDYCAWFLMDRNFFNKRYVKYDDEDYSRGDKLDLKLSPYEAYYKTYRLTSFDLMLERTINNKLNNLSMLQTRTTGQSDYSSGQILGKIFGKKAKADPPKADSLDDQESDSSENDQVERQDVSVMYCDHWPYKSALMNCTSDSSLYTNRKHTSHRRKSNLLTSSNYIKEGQFRRSDLMSFDLWMPKTEQIYGFQLKSPTNNKRDWSKYERFVAIGQRNHIEVGEIKSDFTKTITGGRDISSISIIGTVSYIPSKNPSSALSVQCNGALCSDDGTHHQSIERTHRPRLIVRGDSVSPLTFEAISLYTSDSIFGLEPPEVLPSALHEYERVVRRAQQGPDTPIEVDMLKYISHVAVR